MSSIPGRFGKSNCSAFSTFIWIIRWPWCEFSLLASSTRVLVQVILPTFSHSSPFSSYWISMVVEIQISLWGIKHTENCDRAIYYFKVVSSRMNLYLFKKGVNNVLLSWFLHLRFLQLKIQLYQDAYFIYLIASPNYRKVWVKRNIKNHLVLTALPWTGMPSIKWDCSKPIQSALNTSRGGASTTSPHSPFQGFTSHTTMNSFQISDLNLLSYSLKPLCILEDHSKVSLEASLLHHEKPQLPSCLSCLYRRGSPALWSSFRLSSCWTHSSSTPFSRWGAQSWTQHHGQRGRIPSSDLHATLLWMQPRTRIKYFCRHSLPKYR